MLWGGFRSLQAYGLDSGESSAESPHLANISVSVRALTGTNRLLMTQATPVAGECKKDCCPPAACGEVKTDIWCQDSNNSHTHKQTKNTPPENTAWWSPTRTMKVHSSTWSAINGAAFSDQVGYFCWGFGFTIAYSCARKDITVVLIRDVLFIQSWQMTTDTEASHA